MIWNSGVWQNTMVICYVLGAGLINIIKRIRRGVDMFDFLFKVPDYDLEVYKIAYQAKTMSEAFEMTKEYEKKLGGPNMIIGLALSQASIRLKENKEEV